jgi:steroid delta-isomerase-like uncharacterized protein
MTDHDHDVADAATAQEGDITRKAFVGAGAATAASLLAAPAALGKPRKRKKRPTAAQRAARLRAERERIVIEHAHTENIHQFETTLDTFAHARYEIIPLGDIHDGESDVATYYQETRQAFPDQRNSQMMLRHADEAVITEFILSGTMKGAIRGIPPTGRSFRVRCIALFLFLPGGTKIVAERVYFDLYTLLQQLGLLEVAAVAGLRFPENGGIPIEKDEPGAHPVDT